MSTKAETIDYLKATIGEYQRILTQISTIEQDKIYKFTTHGTAILGRVTGFTYGPMSCNIVLQVYAAQNHYAYRQRSYSQNAGMITKATEVSVTEFPLYIGWNTTPAFEKKIKKG